MATTDLLELSQSDRETLEAWLVEFDTAWQEDALATWVTSRLPGLDQRLRRTALAEMVKVDLETAMGAGTAADLGFLPGTVPGTGDRPNGDGRSDFRRVPGAAAVWRSRGLGRFGAALPPSSGRVVPPDPRRLGRPVLGAPVVRGSARVRP